MAGELDWEDGLVWIDDCFEYDETRMITLALKMEILYDAGFVDRGNMRRAISRRLLTGRNRFFIRRTFRRSDAEMSDAPNGIAHCIVEFFLTLPQLGS